YRVFNRGAHLRKTTQCRTQPLWIDTIVLRDEIFLQPLDRFFLGGASGAPRCEPLQTYFGIAALAARSGNPSQRLAQRFGDDLAKLLTICAHGAAQPPACYAKIVESCAVAVVVQPPERGIRVRYVPRDEKP